MDMDNCLHYLNVLSTEVFNNSVHDLMFFDYRDFEQMGRQLYGGILFSALNGHGISGRFSFTSEDMFCMDEFVEANSIDYDTETE